MVFEEKINILIVDDKPENLLALEAVLERIEQNVVKANSGEEALGCLLIDDFSLILLDVQMPGLDGFETAKIIRERQKTKDIPIIFLTAINRDDVHASKGYSLGAVDYIFKPINPEILLSKVKVFVTLAQKNNELKKQIELYKELESFTYSISHDLGAPLRMISSFSSLLLTKHSESLNQDGKEFLNIISNQALQMKQLIDDLINFSKLTYKEINKSVVDMKSLVESVLDTIQKSDLYINTKVILNDIPNAYGDRPMLKQVLMNLISNAFKYSSKVKQPEVEIGFINKNGLDFYYVKDNGVGFDMSYSSRIFEAFQRLHTSGEFEGTGIGLAIVKRVINKHKGKIFVESKENEGATFYFMLPSMENNPQ
ncbi:MAG: response regulator [Candidatus Sericytochromatia bacterium]